MGRGTLLAHACMHAHTHTHTHAMHTHTHARTHTHAHAHTHACTHTHTHARTHAHVRAHTQWSIEPVPPEGGFGEEVEQMKVKEELYKEVSVSESLDPHSTHFSPLSIR